MSYFLALVIAGFFEVSGVIFLSRYSKSKGIKKATNFLFIVASFACSLMLLSYAMQGLAMSVAYAIWTGIGTIGAVCIGVFINKENMNLKKGFFLFLVIFSVIMLKIV